MELLSDVTYLSLTTLSGKLYLSDMKAASIDATQVWVWPHRFSDVGGGVCQHRAGGPLQTADSLPGQAQSLCPVPCLLSVPAGQAAGVSGERAGRQSGWQAAGSIGWVGPKLLAEAVGAEGGVPTDRGAEEGVAFSCGHRTADCGACAPPPHHPLLPQQLLLPPVKESGWNQLRESFMHHMGGGARHVTDPGQ